MVKNKTLETENSVAQFLSTITNEKKRNDCLTIINLITNHTQLEPKMWGTSIVGFGSYHYKYDSGREGDAPLTGIAARVNGIVLYLVSAFSDREELLLKFGKHKTDKGCVQIKKLEDVDTNVLIKMVQNSIDYIRKQYPI
ncbi:MAG: DUF1801 domain-containing protein [Pedobacter sp.]|nr:DUF1801 domain-containing protein [Chitinophagaceae bacterium]